jgi:hypothetical protein
MHPQAHDLSTIHRNLQQPDAAQGVLTFLRQFVRDTDSLIEPSWYEKLGEWPKAKVAYEEKLEQSPDRFELAIGRSTSFSAAAAFMLLLLLCDCGCCCLLLLLILLSLDKT